MPTSPIPPVPPRHHSRTAALVGASAALTLVVAVAITLVYVVSEDEGPAGQAAQISLAPSTSPAEESPEPAAPSPSPEFDPDEFEIPAGYLGVRSLGALTREPDGFEEYAGPAEATQVSVDAHTYNYQTHDGWMSSVSVGVFDANGVVLDTDDLEGTAEAALEAWAHSSAFEQVSGMTIEWVDTQLLPVDGKTGAMTAAMLRWDPGDHTQDTSEAVQLILVEIDETTAWIGLASVTESHFDSHYEAATFALINTTFAI
ncbi:hypothetical protein L0U85_00315 [Glycomyces sp. L485]|uniref:hypothetical protein n=1 Tax=Glycomyces sp. L485 TaxID=2909235 RepID=UPI001F4AD2FA|nr:hypothetical protein [Glycomyces sp. L485]MCH7229314.1 hypothetical protein [Glycomyces sp. L485]